MDTNNRLKNVSNYKHDIKIHFKCNTLLALNYSRFRMCR